MGLGPTPGGSFTALDISVATVVKTTPGSIVTVNVLVQGSTVGAVYDFAATTGYTAANQVGTIPQLVGSYPMNSFPCFTAILVVPGTGQTVSVAYS